MVSNQSFFSDELVTWRVYLYAHLSQVEDSEDSIRLENNEEESEQTNLD